MSEPREPLPVLLMLAVFSRHAEAFRWARQKLSAAWGPLALEGTMVEFDETDYYEATMGGPLRKQLWAFQYLVDADRLPELKHQTNAWEQEYARQASHAEPRPLNLDPGYVTQAKLVLASTKDHAHRIYLDRGIYAEVTLRYHKGRWEPWPWTYPDYRRTEHQHFLEKCRHLLKEGLPRRSID